jgi:subtilisin family serine protease
MKHLYVFLTLSCLVGVFATSVNAQGSGIETSSRSTIEKNIALSVQRILVTFPDETDDRVPVASTASAYRVRGSYQNSTWSQHIAEQLANQYGLQREAQWPMTTLGINCVVYEVLQNQEVTQVIHRLEQDNRVESAQVMNTFHALSEGDLSPSYNDPYLKLQADMRSMRITSAHQISTGRHIKIAVIDTGIDQNHSDLLGQVSHTANYVLNAPESSTDVHGTAVAGIIAALANNEKGIVGVAPGATLLSLKACWQNGAGVAEAICDTFTLAQALDTAIKLQPNIINLSLTGPKDSILERLIDKALDRGIIVVASNPGLSASNEFFPASMKRVISVRTAESTGGSKKLDSQSVAAPGKEILTTLPNDTYNFMSGSSFAAAHVSGLIALLLEVNPNLSTQQIVQTLHTAMSPSYDVQTAEAIDACIAINSIRKGDACSHVTVAGTAKNQHPVL